MKKIFVAVLFVCVCLVYAVNSYAEEFFISGKVTSLGKGVQGVEINIDDQLYETDDDGCYKTENMQAGTEHIIKIERLDFVSSPSVIKIKSLDGNIDNANFVVYGEITGQVLYNDMPLKNAIVKISDRQQEYFTDDKGNYRILNVGLNQEYTVSVSSESFTVAPKKIILRSVEPVIEDTPVAEGSVADDKATEVKEKEIEENTNILNFKAEVSKCNVTVSVMHGLMPLENAEIIVNNDTKNKYKTDREGICKIENLVCNRKYIIKAQKKGVDFVKKYITIDRLTSDTKIDFEALVDVSGTVTVDGKPFADAIIECGDRKAKTDKNGRYVFNGLVPNNPYIVKPVSSMFTFSPNEVVIKSLRNSLAETNFATTTNIVIADDETAENKKLLQKEISEKMASAKKEASVIMKEETAKQKAVALELKKAQAEEDLRVKEEILQEQTRIKEKQLQEEQDRAAYKASLEQEALKETIAETEAKLAPVKQKHPVIENKEEVAPEQEEETISIQGRVMKNKDGVSDVQIMLICPPETKKLTTDRNGFYKISGLEKNKNYVVTVLADSKTTKLSPKSRMYKDLDKSMKNQNFYYMVEKDKEISDTAENKK